MSVTPIFRFSFLLLPRARIQQTRLPRCSPLHPQPHRLVAHVYEDADGPAISLTTLLRTSAKEQMAGQLFPAVSLNTALCLSAMSFNTLLRSLAKKQMAGQLYPDVSLNTALCPP